MSPGFLTFAKLVMMSSALAYKICGGCQIRVTRSIHSINVVPYNLNFNSDCVSSCYVEPLLPTITNIPSRRYLYLCYRKEVDVNIEFPFWRFISPDLKRWAEITNL